MYQVQFSQSGKCWFGYGIGAPEQFEGRREAQKAVDMLTAPTGPGGMSLAKYARIAIDARGELRAHEIPRACTLAQAGDVILLRGEWQIAHAENCLQHLGTQGVKLEVVDESLEEHRASI